MKLAYLFAAAALAGGALLTPVAASAQTSIDSLGLTVTVTPAITSDYLFRGISQTRSGPAVQGTIDIEHSTGLYVGAFLSNAAFVGTNARQELDLMAGYRFSLADVKFDVGATYFIYPGYEAAPGGFDLAWWEVNLRASYELDPLKFVGLAAYSPNFNLESGNAFYLEGGFDAKLAYDITASFRAGYQWVEYNTSGPADHGTFGAPDYAVFSFGLSREIAYGFIGGVTLSHTTLTRNDCFGGQNICGTRFVATLSRPF